MIFLTKSTVAIYLSLLLLTACGGGSSGDSKPTPAPTPTPTQPTPSNIIGDAKNYSLSELNNASTQLVETRYSGLTSDAKIDVALAQKAFLSLFNDSSTEMPEVGSDNFREKLDANGNINAQLLCDYQGHVTYNGKLNSNFEGNVSLTYDDCRNADHDSPITGSVAISFIKITDTSAELSYYFDNLRWQAEEQSLKLTGYSNLVSIRNYNTDVYSVHNKQHLLFTKNNQQVLLKAELALTNDSNQSSVELAGDLFFSDKGKIAVELENVFDFPPYIYSGRMLLNASNKAAFEFDYPYIRYVEDSNGDQNYDVGTYFVDINELLYGDAYSKRLVALAELSLPPTSNPPRLVYHDKIDTTTPL